MTLMARAVEKSALPSTLASVCVFCHANGDERETPQPICAKAVTTIPFRMVGGLILIEAEIDSIRGNFILDTGAPYLVLNSTYFRAYEKESGALVSGITGGGAAQLTTIIPKLELRGISYSDVEADLSPLGAIEDARGIKIFGLLGANLFASFEMEINVRTKSLRLFRCDKRGNTEEPNTSEADILMPIEFQNNTLLVKAEIAGKRLLFGLDTGAEINALSSKAGNKVLETITITGRSDLLGTGPERIEIIFGRMNDFVLQENVLMGMRTIITGMDDMSRAYGRPIDGMLGFDFLSKGIVTINFIKPELRIKLFDNFKTD